MTADEITIPSCCSQDAALIFDGEYDVPMERPPLSVLDIGANVGLFTAWAAQLWPDARITAFEPWPENAQMLRDNTRRFPNVSVAESGVLAHGGRRGIRDNGYSVLHSFTRGDGQARDVDCVSAGDITSHEFVKIDTEGSELEIVQNLDLTATRWIVLEAHTAGDAHTISDFLTAKGFAVYDTRPSEPGCYLMKFIRRDAIVQDKLFVAVPTYSGSPTQFWKCLMKLEKDPPCNLSIQNIDGDSLVSRARNTLTASFLRSDCSHMLFIDSDLVFSREHVGRIMRHSQEVVAGFYPKKQDGRLAWVCNAIAGEKPDENGLQSVRYMGTGFIRVARSVFVKMIARWGREISYHPDSAPTRTEYDLWPVGPYQYPDGNRRYLSEDWYFCQRWLDLGGKVYGDTRIVLRHVGHAVYPLSSQIPEIANPIEASNRSDTA